MSGAITVERPEKRYRLGPGSCRHDALRDALIQTLKTRAGRLRGQARSGSARGKTISALRDVSFQVHQGDAPGIIGRNDSGKTALLQIPPCITEPTEGQARTVGRVAPRSLRSARASIPSLRGKRTSTLRTRSSAYGVQRSTDASSRFKGLADWPSDPTVVSTPKTTVSSRTACWATLRKRGASRGEEQRWERQPSRFSEGGCRIERGPDRRRRRLPTLLSPHR